MTEATRGRLLSLLSLVALALLVYIPARVAWERATTPPPADHGLAALAEVQGPAGTTWACVIDAIAAADLPGASEGFAVEVNDDEDLDADFIVDRALGGDLRGTIGIEVLVIRGLPTTQRIPLEC